MQIIGHSKQRDSLLGLVERNMLAHAQIFSGPQGVGKKLVAREFSRFLVCSNKRLVKDCTCNNCTLALKDSHPDIMTIEARDKTRWNTEGVRELLYTLNLKNFQASARIVIINDAEDLNVQSSNALLKQIEEPSKNTYFFIVTENSSKLLPTIQSRCQAWFFSLLRSEEVTQILEQNKFNDLKAQFPIDLLLKLANGSLSTLEILSQQSDLWENLEKALNQISHGDNYRALALADELKDGKDNLRHCFQLMRTISHSKIRSGDLPEIAKWSKWMADLIKCEDLIFKRNLNAGYSLQDLFYKLSLPN